MRIKLWSVRGSLPAPVSPDQVRQSIQTLLQKFAASATSGKLDPVAFLNSLPHHLTGGYGGNTSCGEITHGNTRILIDAGSGLRAFSDSLAADKIPDQEFHLYFTHFHWDHLIGLPFFAPLFRKGRIINCYAVHADLEESFKILFRKPNFPVPYEVVKGQLRLHQLEPRVSKVIGDLTLTPYELDHPDPCWGARIEGGGKSVAWCVDTEGLRTSRTELGADLALYANADLMVFDAQYSFGDALEKINWGHSSGPVGVDLAIREGVKLALFVHHDPGSSDAKIHDAEQQTKAYFDELIKARAKAGHPPVDFTWRFGREGEVIEL